MQLVIAYLDQCAALIWNPALTVPAICSVFRWPVAKCLCTCVSTCVHARPAGSSCNGSYRRTLAVSFVTHKAADGRWPGTHRGKKARRSISAFHRGLFGKHDWQQTPGSPVFLMTKTSGEKNARSSGKGPWKWYSTIVSRIEFVRKLFNIPTLTVTYFSS